VDCCVCGLEYFPYSNYSRKPTGQEFFVLAKTLIVVKLLKTLFTLGIDCAIL